RRARCLSGTSRHRRAVPSDLARWPSGRHLPRRGREGRPRRHPGYGLGPGPFTGACRLGRVMHLVHWLRGPPDTSRPTSVTVGFFDGVHRGHQAVIGRTVDVAGQRGLTPVAVTFDRHPRETYAPGTEPPLLTTLERKSGLITGLGVEGLLVLEFTHELAAWPPQEFVDRVLVDTLHASYAAVGSNFTFGHKAMGTLTALAELGAARGFDVEGMSLMRVGGRVVSSSEVRTAIGEG